MERTHQIANRFREVLLNGLWVANTNYQDQLTNLTWEQATTQIDSLNTIALLTQHINYYIAGVLQVFKGGNLEISDRYSFDFPPIKNQEEWDIIKQQLLDNAEQFATAIESMPDTQLDAIFVDQKYGTYERNIEGMIEHCYYHLGQISLLKKMVLSSYHKL